jgi:hypothetical protein
MEANEKLQEIDEEEFGGYPPAPMVIQETFATLDNFIRKRMGGERVGLRIRWILNGEHWFFDPWSGELQRDN